MRGKQNERFKVVARFDYETSMHLYQVADMRGVHRPTMPTVSYNEARLLADRLNLKTSAKTNAFA